MSTIDIDRTTAGPLAGSSWQLDPERSRVEFRVKQLWGLATVAGHFEDFSGALTVAAEGEVTIILDIEAESVATGNLSRDAHLRSPDFFDAVDHPRVAFRSTRVLVEDEGRRLSVAGELEAAGGRVPVDFDAEVAERDGELEIRAITYVDQRRLGMTSRRLGIRSPAVLNVTGVLKPDKGWDDIGPAAAATVRL